MQRLLFDFLFFSLGEQLAWLPCVFYRLADSLTEK